MAENSGIEWTHHTFNPWIGCTKVSAACDNCYAEAWDSRFKGDRWGSHAARTRTKNWSRPLKWNKEAAATGQRKRVFCASLADIFDNHNSIQQEWRDDLWKLIEQTSNLDWLILTKRPQNVMKFATLETRLKWSGNVWLGVTVENQLQLETRVPYLAGIRCKHTFLSMEPLLGQVDLSTHTDFIDWVIVGGESGVNHRAANPDWFRSIRDQCAEAEIPFLFKQWSGRSQKEIKAMGRHLDGVLHNGYPI